MKRIRAQADRGRNGEQPRTTGAREKADMCLRVHARAVRSGEDAEFETPRDEFRSVGRNVRRQ